MIEKMMKVNVKWESDWNGEDLGYPEIEVIGLYSMELPAGEEEPQTLYFYIDAETDALIEAWTEQEYQPQ